MFYTYSHCKPDGSIFYIGKGMGERAWSKDDRNPYWKRTVAKYGYVVQILARWKTDAEALDHEKLLISCLRDMGIKLVNLTNGGEGSEGYKWTDEQKARFDISGEKNGMFGKKHSEETRKKIADKAKGRVTSAETKAKLSVIFKGRKVSDETVERLRKSGTGRPVSEETRAKISLERKGKKLSQEHREKIGLGGTGRKNSPETIEKMRASAFARHEKKQLLKIKEI